MLLHEPIKYCRAGSPYKKLLQDCIHGKTRKTQYIYEMAKADRLSAVRPKEAYVFAKQIDSMIDILNTTMGNNWDFYYYPFAENWELDRFGMYVALYYPKIKIVNAFKEKHLIKELYVFLHIESNASSMESEGTDNSCQEGIHKKPRFYFDTQIGGCRAYLNYDEFFLNYSHSHLHTAKYTNHKPFDIGHTFCLGNETPLQKLLRAIRVNGYKEELFQLLLLSLEDYLKWESLEGVPYVQMDKLTLPKNLADGKITGNFDRTWKYIYLCYSQWGCPDLNFVYKGDRFGIKNDELFDKFLRNGLDCDLDYAEGIYYVAGANTKYWFENGTRNMSYRETLVHQMKVDDDHWWFRDKKVTLTIEKPNESDNLYDTSGFEIDPGFKGYAIQEMEKMLFIELIKQRNERLIGN